MLIDLKPLLGDLKTLAVALSGGSDSMALLHYMASNAEKLKIKVVALNVEHGIRGESSKKDSLFVKEYCHAHSIPLISYEIDCKKYATENHLSIEETARVLRYNCFFDAINNGKCDKVATAHHASDNAESVLFNLFRGTGAKGATGIKQNYKDKIIRPFLYTEKAEIQKYIEENNIPFVTDESNFSTEYTRNYIRLNVMPEILKVFPEAIKSINRFAEISTKEDLFLDELADKNIKYTGESLKKRAEINLPLHPVLLSRATIKVLKALGVKKDWEKAHIDAVLALQENQTGRKIDLPCELTVIKEYEKLIFFRQKEEKKTEEINFAVGEFDFCGQKISIKKENSKNIDLKGGFYADFDKIPEDAVIRTRKDGDVFTKFGGGTKPLSDFFTEKKIPLLERDTYPLIASGKTILAVFGLAVSEKIKVGNNTDMIIKLTKEKV